MLRMTFTPNNEEETTPEIDKTNKLIAEFMFINNGLDYINPLGEYSSYNKDGERVKVILNNDDLSELEYHSSWDWLITVVERIEGLNYLVSISYHQCYIKLRKLTAQSIVEVYRETKIKSTYNAIVDFIKWYNKQKS